MFENYEEYSPAEEKSLSRFVTNTKSNIFVLRNLPEVIKGALFSRYSRSTLGLRKLLLKEFILNEEESHFFAMGASDSSGEDLAVATKKAQDFYDRILDGYGDDSIGELGGAHIAMENVSMLAAKVIEDRRIGGSPLEKSARYVYFDQKIGGEYLYYREPVLMTSAFRTLYIDTCNELFRTYSKLTAELTEIIQEKIPYDPEISKVAYNNSIRAKVLDCLRGLLPASSLTNMGLYGNGRFFETLIRGLHSHNLAEMQEIGQKSQEELGKVIPSFIRRADKSHKTQQSYTQFMEAMDYSLQKAAENLPEKRETVPGRSVSLIVSDKEAPEKVAAALLFAGSAYSLDQLKEYTKTLSEEELDHILEAASSSRENRRHKSPRALEHATFTFEIVADFGVYRDLQRHRMLTQERQSLNCSYGYYVPEEIIGTFMEKEYRRAMDLAKESFDKIAQFFPEEAQYVTPIGYNIRWYFTVNLRALQWICELRSSAAGHSSYRWIAQQMAKQVSEAEPLFAKFFKFVDFENYDLGRLGSEIRLSQKTVSNK